MPEPRPIALEDLARRFAFHPATPDTGPRHEKVRHICHSAAQQLLELVPPGREASLMVTALEETMMWGNAGIARSSAE